MYGDFTSKKYNFISFIWNEVKQHQFTRKNMQYLNPELHSWHSLLVVSSPSQPENSYNCIIMKQYVFHNVTLIYAF